MISLDVIMLHKCYLQDDCSGRVLNISGASGDPLMQSEVMGAATATTAGSGVTDFRRQKASKGISSVATVALIANLLCICKGSLTLTLRGRPVSLPAICSVCRIIIWKMESWETVDFLDGLLCLPDRVVTINMLRVRLDSGLFTYMKVISIPSNIVKF